MVLRVVMSLVCDGARSAQDFWSQTIMRTIVM